MWALLALYQAIRISVCDAVQSASGTDPDRASYHVAIRTAQTLVTCARNITGGEANMTGDIGRAILAACTDPDGRVSAPRRIKSPISCWAKHPPGKPQQHKKITAVTTVISRDTLTATRRRRSVTNPGGP